MVQCNVWLQKHLTPFFPVWGLGLLLFSLMTLNPPYTGIEDYERYISKGIRPTLQLHSEMTLSHKNHSMWPSLTSIFEECTKENPDERPDTTTILKLLQQLTPGAH